MELDVVIKYIKKLSAVRSDLDAESKKLKEQEDTLRMAVYNSLINNNLTSTTIAEVGRVTITSRDHAEIVDYEKLAEFIFHQMLQAQRNKTPLSDVLNLMQKRAKADSVKSFKELGYTEEALGVEVKSKPNISITSIT